MFKLIFKIFLFSLLLQASIIAKEININTLAKSLSLSHKHLFVWLHQNGCPYCANMEKIALNDADVKALIKKDFLEVHINIDENDTIVYDDFKGNAHNFAKSIGYNFYPSSLFIDKNANLVYAVPGYKDESIFFTILNYVSSGSYKKVEFEIYKDDFEFRD
ncbi:MAG: thioredoxin fold domain-containing protein [Sulfurimonas sp.]|nr:thioredoxin fold domain-containing protein [Sulfurimonas sp.]